MPRLAILSIITLVLLAPGAAPAEELTLVDAVRLALTRNERSHIARLNFVAAEAAVLKARAAFLPTITLGGQEKLRPVAGSSKGVVTAPTNGAQGSLGFTQPIVAVTAFPLYASAKHSRDSSHFTEIDQRRQLAFDTARAFCTVVASQNLLTAATRRLEAADASVADTKARVTAQLASTNDLTRSLVERANAVQAIEQARSALEQARVSLEYLLDAEAPAALQAPGQPLYAGALAAPAVTAEGVAARPDLFAARAAALSATAFAEEPRLRFVPTLGATGQFLLGDAPVVGSRYWDTTLLLTLTWTIWDAGVRNADEMSRTAAADVAHLQAKQLQRKIGADVRTAVASLVAARATLTAAEEGVAESRKSVDETVVLYKQGLAKAIELVDANLSRFNAEQSLAAAQLQVHTAELDVRAALGLFPLDGVK